MVGGSNGSGGELSSGVNTDVNAVCVRIGVRARACVSTVACRARFFEPIHYRRIGGVGVLH